MKDYEAAIEVLESWGGTPELRKRPDNMDRCTDPASIEWDTEHHSQVT
jgi:hypothetical protein